MELESEKLRNELALMQDFLPLDGFRILDRYNKQEVEAQDFLTAIQVEFRFSSFNLGEVELLIRRYDRIAGRRLAYGEFLEALTPKESIFEEYFKKKSDCASPFGMLSDARHKFG